MLDGYIAEYLRISDDDKDIGENKIESMSIGSQRKVVQYFISQDDELSKYPVKEFMDDGFSGVNFYRPGIQSLLKEVREKKISCIIVKDLSRFGRNYIEVGDYIEQIFPFMGVRFIAVTDKYDSFRNTGGIEIGFKNLIHDLYSRDLSKKIKSVKKMHQEKGAYSGGDVPFGYVRITEGQAIYQPDSEAAEIVKKIFSLAVKGYTSGNIAKYLNGERIPTPGVYKNRSTNENYQFKNPVANLWVATQIKEILQNEVYIGTFICRKISSIKPREIRYNDKSDYIKFENRHEGLISKEVFEKAGKVVLERGKRGKYKKDENPYSLKGKVKCGHCGYSMNLVRNAKTPKYVCRMGESCGSRLRIEVNQLEEVVLKILQQLILVYKEAAKQQKSEKVKCISELSKYREKRRLLEMNMEHCKSSRLMLYRQWKENKITKDNYIFKRDEYTRQEASYQSSLVDVNNMIKQVEFGEAPEAPNNMPSLNNVQTLTKALADEFIKRIDVYGIDRVQITWKFQDEEGDIPHGKK